MAEKFSPASVHTSLGIDSVQVWRTPCVSGGLSILLHTLTLNEYMNEFFSESLQMSQTAGVSACGSIAARCFIVSVSRFQRTTSLIALI